MSRFEGRQTRSLHGCLEWCSVDTCAHPDCDACGEEQGCDRVVESESHKACASWCNRYTCSLDACLQCSKADAGCEGRDPPSPPSPPPHPVWPPLPQLSLGTWHPSEYYTYSSSIYTNAFGSNGMPARLRIKGAAWFGLESSACHIGGADQRPIESSVAWLKAHGFNAVRIPFAADAVVERHHNCTDRGNLDGISVHNPRLLRMHYRQRIEEVVKVCGDAGLLVLLDAHVTNVGVWPDGGKVDERGGALLTQAWETLAREMCDPELYWNVMGADLKNEPYFMYWGPPTSLFNLGYRQADRWDILAGELGSLIYRICPRWLSFVQGVGHCMSSDAGPCRLPSAPGVQDIETPTWWGENLQGAQHTPVDVGEQRKGVGKVVGSPHTYGPSTYPQPQFKKVEYPDNLPSIWVTQWAFLASRGVMPVVVGEFGGRCTGDDEVFQRRLVQFLTERSIGGF